MAKKFSELRAKMSPEAQEEVKVRADSILKDLALAEMRQSRGMSQVDVAAALNVGQPSVAKIERRDDVLLSTLNGYVAAVGGQLIVQAIFPTGAVDLTSGSTYDWLSAHRYMGRIKTDVGHARAVIDKHIVFNSTAKTAPILHNIMGSRPASETPIAPTNSVVKSRPSTSWRLTTFAGNSTRGFGTKKDQYAEYH